MPASPVTHPVPQPSANDTTGDVDTPQTPGNLSAVKTNLNPTTPQIPNPTTPKIPQYLTPATATPTAVTSAQKLYRTLSSQKGRPLTLSETETLLASTITETLASIKQSPYPCVIRSTRRIVVRKDGVDVGVVEEGTSMVGIEGEGGKVRTVMGWVEEEGVEYLQGTGGLKKMVEWRFE
ncbi:hypothetical protein TrST_g10586 [Triparma strigata]|nr:hypothetical protein TrST_g10586 [Triparma strigata]